MADKTREIRPIETAEDMVASALAVLQRGLPGGDLDDRQVVTELWGIFDSPAAREVYKQGRARP